MRRWLSRACRRWTWDDRRTLGNLARDLDWPPTQSARLDASGDPAVPWLALVLFGTDAELEDAWATLRDEAAGQDFLEWYRATYGKDAT